jgi:hypothetical protein
MYKGLRRGAIIATANEQRIRKGALCLEKRNNSNY